MAKIDSTLAALNLTLPAAPKPVASYVPFVITGNLLFVSGQLPSRDGKIIYTGKVPADVSPEHAHEAAKLATLNALAVLRDACAGNLDAVRQIVRIGVFVQSAQDFSQQSAVANGASDLLVAVFGLSGKHARAAVGVNALPLNACVEVELLAEIGPL